MTLGLVPVSPPLVGPWTCEGFPERVIVGDRVFRRARWRAGRAGVVDQYREERARSSAHLYVWDDGTWSIDHVDDVNPDLVGPLRHFVRDHPVGRRLTQVAGGAAVGVAARMLAHLLF